MEGSMSTLGSHVIVPASNNSLVRQGGGRRLSVWTIVLLVAGNLTLGLGLGLLFCDVLSLGGSIGGSSSNSNSNQDSEPSQKHHNHPPTSSAIRVEKRAVLRRGLLTELQVEAVHSKQDEATTAATSSTTTTATQTTAGNPNIEEPNLVYKPTYHYTSPHGLEPDDSNPQPQVSYFLKDATASKLHDSETFNPQIAWLASFPNSGTSFTMGLVARATNTTFATNYGIEANYGSREVPSLPIYPRHPEGPFMPDPVTAYHHRKLPYGKHVMTKTHCGGYCFNCRPETYAYGYKESNDENDNDDNNDENDSKTNETTAPRLTPGLAFLQDCASGHAIDDRGNMVDVSYPPERVSRVIHLIRNPLHNMIARFHLERKHHADANTESDQEWLKEHPDNQIGMSRFCSEENDRRWDQETKFFESDYFDRTHSTSKSNTQTTYARRNGDKNSPTESRFPEDFTRFKELASKVPCRGDLFRYVQWHNLLHQSLDYLPYKLPVLTLYYEGFESATYQATATSILDFLDLQPVPDENGNIKWNEFHSRSDYDEFFSEEQTEVIREFLQTLSSFRVWGEIEHYFQ